MKKSLRKKRKRVEKDDSLKDLKWVFIFIFCASAIILLVGSVGHEIFADEKKELTKGELTFVALKDNVDYVINNSNETIYLEITEYGTGGETLTVDIFPVKAGSKKDVSFNRNHHYYVSKDGQDIAYVKGKELSLWW